MKNVILLLYLGDEEYGRRLLRFLSGKRNPGLHPELVTEREKIEIRVGTDLQELVVLTDCREIKEDEKKKVIYLSRERDRNKRKIFQYQKAEGIYQDLLKLLEMDTEDYAPAAGETEESCEGVYAVFSPGGTGGTVLSTALAQYLGGRGNCLYLSLAGFPVLYGDELTEEPDLSGGGIGELLFFSGGREFAVRERELRRPFGAASMLAPVQHYKDWLDCAPKEWEELLARLRRECGYDSIVAEFGQLFDGMFDFMEKAGRIWVIQEDGVFGKVHRSVFRRYCGYEKKDEMLRRTEFIRLPWEFREWEQELSQQPVAEFGKNSARMACIGELVRNKGGDTDVCIIEEDE